jgi:DNA end-binding protein Ku
MARPIWKGHISFGLVNVPVTLFGAENRNDVSFHLLDSRDSARVRYERVNEVTGEEVPWDKIIKGYEYSDGNYVLLKEEELERAQAELTKTIEIEQFIKLEEIDVRYFDKPYYLVPAKGGDKGYVLLREAMKATGRVGIARVVIRARGYMAAMMPQGDALILEMLRFDQELRPLDDYEFPKGNKGGHKVTAKEVDLAKSLVEGMAGEWEPDKYRDEYRNALMKLIQRRIKAGQTESNPEEPEEPDEPPPTVNFMDVLKKSMKHAEKPKRAASRTTSHKTAQATTRKPRKKKAG